MDKAKANRHRVILRDNIWVLNKNVIQKIIHLASDCVINGLIYEQFRMWSREFLENCITKMYGSIELADYNTKTLTEEKLIEHSIIPENLIDYERIMPKLPFYRLIMEIIQDIATNEKVSRIGAEQLKHYWLDHSFKLFKKAAEIMVTSGRKTLFPSDLIEAAKSYLVYKSMKIY